MVVAAALRASAGTLYHRQKGKATNKKNSWVLARTHGFDYNIAMHNNKIQAQLAVVKDFLTVVFLFAFVYSLMWVGFAFGF